MSGFTSFRGFTLMFVTAFLIWSFNFEACIARRGKHWRQHTGTSESLYKKGKSHGSNNQNYHASKPKPKPKPKPNPSHKTTPPSPSWPSPSPPIPNPKENDSSISPTPPYNGGAGHSTSVFNVLDFGAKGDGCSDDTKAFQDTWAAACKVEASTMLVPANYVFYVGPIAFSGP